MTNIELEIQEWEARVAKAAGWSSAYFAASELERLVKEAKRQGIEAVNKYPIAVAGGAGGGRGQGTVVKWLYWGVAWIGGKGKK